MADPEQMGAAVCKLSHPTTIPARRRVHPRSNIHRDSNIYANLYAIGMPVKYHVIWAAHVQAWWLAVAQSRQQRLSMYLS
jgi:hypothetical protein